METTAEEEGMCNITVLLTLDSYHSVEGQMLLLFVVTSLTVFTTVSNAVIIHLTRTSSELRSLGPLRSLIGSMAFADLLMGAIIMPVTGHQYLLKRWALGHLGCKIFMWFVLVVGTSSIFHLCVIAVDRYLAILHPMVYKRVEVQRWYTLCLITIAWSVSLAMAAPVYIYDLEQIWQEGSDLYCDIPHNGPYAALMTGVIFAIPYCVIWGIYLRIYCMSRGILKQRMRKTLKAFQHINAQNMNKGKGSEPRASGYELSGLLCMPQLLPTSLCTACQAKIPSVALKAGLCKVCRAPNNLMAAAMEARIKALMFANRRSFLITIIITGAFTLCYIPIGIRHQVAAVCPDCRMSCALSNSLTWLTYANSGLNPVIYTVFNNKFRQAFKKWIGC